jgi:hypothetical protein
MASFITIESKCGHHRADLNAVVMLVLAGNITSRTALQCPSWPCMKIAFYIDVLDDRPDLVLFEGGAKR